MRCPACEQSSEVDRNGDCPLCGFPAGEVNRKVVTIYIVTSAIFFSTLIYAVIIYVLSTAATIEPIQPAELIFYILAAAAVVLAAVMLAVKNIIVKAALCEAPAVFGLVAFLLSGDIARFVVLLGISWVMFLIMSPQVVSSVNAIRREAVEQWRSREHR